MRALSVDVPTDGPGFEPGVNGETQPERRESSLEVHLLVLAVRLAVPGQRINGPAGRTDRDHCPCSESVPETRSITVGKRFEAPYEGALE